jgi:hypothetical protein
VHTIYKETVIAYSASTEGYTATGEVSVAAYLAMCLDRLDVKLLVSLYALLSYK